MDTDSFTESPGFSAIYTAVGSDEEVQLNSKHLLIHPSVHGSINAIFTQQIIKTLDLAKCNRHSFPHKMVDN